MSVTLYEAAKSRDTVIDLRAGSTTVNYVALVAPPYDVSDNEDLMTAVSETAPLRNGFQLRRGWDVKHQGGRLWMVAVNYGFDEGDAVDPGPGDLLPYEFSFDCTGGTQHITQSIITDSSFKYGAAARARNTIDAVTVAGSATLTCATANFTQADVGAPITATNISTGVAMLPAGTTILSVQSATSITLSANALFSGSDSNLSIGAVPPPNFNRAIGVSKDGVAGCDKIAPKVELQITRRLLGITTQYISNLRLLTGRTNDAPFYGFDVGECLFLGASGAPSQNNQAAMAPEARVTFRFAASPNEININISGDGQLIVPFKSGWSYIWVYFVPAVDPVARRAITRPDAVYVERIYFDGDFSLLGIGS